MIQAVFNRALAKGFRSAVSYSPVPDAVHKYIDVPRSLDGASTTMMDAPAVTVLVAKFITREVAKGSLHKVKLGEQFKTLAESLDESRIQIEDGIPRKRIDLIRSSSSPTNTSDD